MRLTLCLIAVCGLACGGLALGPAPACDGGCPDAGPGGAPDAGPGGPDAGPGGPDAGPGNPDGGSATILGGCSMLPANHIFNTPINHLPVHPDSGAFMATIGSHKIHLDLGTQTDQQAADFYGIPYNLVHAGSLTWANATYRSADPGLSWDPTVESDCARGSDHQLISPCTAQAAPQPQFPIPASPIVEGGIDKTLSQPYGDHHLLMLDQDGCRIWEIYHAYPDPKGGWDIFGSATFDLRSNALRPDGWTSTDAAGFPILPLLLKASEAQSGKILHALRFTIQSSKIRTSYVWPARHLTTNGTSSQSLPPMGQLFRLKASYLIPQSYGVQSRAILTALQTYGMYLADGGSDLFVTGDPSAAWSGNTLSEVQSVTSAQFEAVDLSGVLARPGFDPNSAAVP